MTAILAVTLKSMAPLLLALGVVPMLRRQSAALRHLVLTMAIVAALLAPLAGLVLPSWSMPPRLTAPLLAGDQAVVTDAAPVGLSQPAAAPATFVERAAATTATTWRIASLVWLSGATISMFVLICGLVRIAWLVRRATPIGDPVWTATAAVVSRRLGLRKPVRLLETRHSTLLVTIGIVRPSLLVPTAALTWAPDRVAVVLEHELAHVARHDWIVQVMAELVRAWHWFNPVAWAVCARLRQESEHASDDMVLAGGVDGVAYAEQLVTIARELRATRQWLPALSMAQPSGFERRIRMLITPVNRRPVSRTTAVVVALVALVITVPLAAAAMQAVARVTGSVADPQSGLLPGVVMVLTNTATHERREIHSDRSGRFEFASLDAGDYLLEARLPGFDAFTSKLTVVNGTVQQDLKLDIGVVQETITLRASQSRAEPARAPAPPDDEQFRRLQEIKRKRDAQRCTTEPVRSAPFIGGNIRVPIKLKDVKPVYPESMRTAGKSGTVLLNARISKDGLLDDISPLSSPDPAFTDAAIQAVSRWEFDGTLLNCTAVDTRLAIRVNFEIEP